jgi:ubiquinone/menaquinone biosynthesis C-methylase UbiE
MTLQIPDERYYTGRIMPFNVSEKGRAEMDEVIRLLRSAGVSGRVLDVGCGPGLNVDALRSVEPAWSVFGVDYSPDGVQIAARKVGGSFLILDAHRLAFQDAAFGGVIMTHAIGHVADPDRVLAEIRRVIAPGGAAVITTPNGRYVEVYRVFNERGILPYKRDPTVLRYYDAESLGRALTEAGFSVKSLVHFGGLPRLEARLLEMDLLPPGTRLVDDTRRERLIALVTKENP